MSKTRRLFFALWPDPDIRRSIVARREVLGDLRARRVPDHNLHLTLAFLGDVPADAVDSIERCGDAAGGEPFRLRLDRFGTFERARVAWLGGPPVPPGDALAADLSAGAGELGIQVDPRPWQPHVTLFRQVAKLPHRHSPEPLDWPVGEFSLIESKAGRPYQVLRTWPLQ